jgi:hypothetical protein
MTIDSPVPYSPSPLNTALLERVRQLILMHPGLHDQGTWGQTMYGRRSLAKIAALAEVGSPCGTTACVAGWAAIFTAPEDAYLCDAYIYIGTKAHAISTYAGRQLGLTWAQQCWLFAGDASRDRVLWTLKWLPDHPDASDTDLAQAWYLEQLAGVPGHGA